ncbi:hypothetical protein EXIGLDRAFT_689441 [Exidia glandulosa HHB12029]|uniref:Reverse transcriptase zinc-binding domain-containing protein n=1 Tax=Exidia glandulosa HHB12029 TaxID=1314781 RepID=A0A166N9E5_EXIGL|nr:hypothetical protein EXIGLDRAFT_689441 [Exidia glandulosa HHB12029]
MNFFWEGKKKHPINADTIKGGKLDGGHNVFDVKSRNDAAYIVWLRQYLAPEEKRPLWAFLADTIFALHARQKDAKKLPLEARFNPFTQDWKPNKNKLPFILKQVLRVATQYQLVLDAPFIPEAVRVQLPAWSHIARSDPERARQMIKTANCLRNNHEAYTVEALQEICEQTREDHVRRANCGCEDCTHDREDGCKAPYLCQELANDVLARTTGKWNVDVGQYEYDTPLARDLGPASEEAVRQNKPVIFNPVQLDSEVLSQYFRIFTKHLAITRAPAEEIVRREAGIREGVPEKKETLIAYACGSTLHGRTAEAQGGYAVHFPDGGADDETGPCTGEQHSEERSAATAILRAALAVPLNRNMEIRTNSKRAVQRLTTKLKSHEDLGWSDVGPNASVYRRTVAALRRRTGELSLTYAARSVRDTALAETVHSAREAARERARDTAQDRARETREAKRLTPFDAPGAALATMTQRKANSIIKQIRAEQKRPRRKTTANLAGVRDAAGAAGAPRPTDDQIWQSLRNKDVSRNIRNFMWKGIHGGHKIGDYFNNMPSPWKEYAQCTRCGEEESMEHIMLRCTDPARRKIWGLAKRMLSAKKAWRPPKIGDIWGCALGEFRDAEGKRRIGAERAYRIIMSESAFLIWKMRCERRIQHEDDPEWRIPTTEIVARWYNTINKRIAMDRLLTNTNLFKRKAIKKETVKETWRGMLEQVKDLPNDWTKHPGVLVGIGTSLTRRGQG